MRKTTLLLLIFLLGFSTILAQEDETFTTDNFSVTVPAGWVVESSDGQVFIATSQNALDILSPGEASVTILLPEILATVGIDTEADPVVAIETLMDLLGDDTTEFGPIETFELQNGTPGAQVTVTDNETFETFVTALVYEEGIVVAAFETSPGEFESFLDEFVLIGESIQYGSAITADELLRQWASNATGTSEYSNPNWGFIQATGAPDTTVCGDETTAWASATSTGMDILVLEYAELVQPTEINIYQTYNPGAIISVEVSNNTEPNAETYVLPNSEDPPGNTDCPGVFTIEITEELPPINTVIIYLDQAITDNWNEIDAVELVGVPVNSDETSMESDSGEWVTEVMYSGASYNYPAGWESIDRFDAWYVVNDPTGDLVVTFSDTEDAVNVLGDTPLFDDPVATMEAYRSVYYPTSESDVFSLVVFDFDGRPAIFREFNTPSGVTALVYIVQFSNGEYGVVDAQFTGTELTDETYAIVEAMATSFDQSE
ncbi:MAG: hypothetical protein CUN56_10985 [Phototrophicales bacterium]|nr:MAG: hypothetical protein CUN56_10985 [Phototrophicales bacterium]RMG70699.1 MAG: hypothetical protein D6711_16725 [Chloroflexota bacterium]